MGHRHSDKTKVLLGLLLLLLQGCQTPFLVFPGGALKGDPATTDTFAFAEAYSLLKLEVNPAEPYSVILRCTVIDGAIYVDAAPARKWGQYLAQTPAVKVLLNGKLYAAIAVPVSDQELLERFIAGRTVYRLDPQ